MTASLYDVQGNLHNPAVAGVNKQTTMGASYRSMWSGIAGSPVTALVYGSTFLEKANIGVGAYLYSDVTGPTSRRGFKLPTPITYLRTTELLFLLDSKRAFSSLLLIKQC